MSGAASAPDVLEEARAAAARQDFARADALYGQLFAQGEVAARIESLRYLAMRAFRAGDPGRAVDFSRQVTGLEPGVSAHWLNLGVAAASWCIARCPMNR